MKTSGTAYVLWCACFFGGCGIHRFYLGKYGTGLLYFFTFGLFGIGQFIDLFLIPGMVERENKKEELQRGATVNINIQGVTAQTEYTSSAQRHAAPAMPQKTSQAAAEPETGKALEAKKTSNQPNQRVKGCLSRFFKSGLGRITDHFQKLGLAVPGHSLLQPASFC